MDRVNNRHERAGDNCLLCRDIQVHCPKSIFFLESYANHWWYWVQFVQDMILSGKSAQSGRIILTCLLSFVSMKTGCDSFTVSIC